MVLEDHGPRGKHSLGALAATAKHRSLELDLWRLWEWVSEIAWKVWIGYLGSTLDPGRNLWRPATLLRDPPVFAFPSEITGLLFSPAFFTWRLGIWTQIFMIVYLSILRVMPVSLFFYNFGIVIMGNSLETMQKIQLLVISNVIV